VLIRFDKNTDTYPKMVREATTWVAGEVRGRREGGEREVSGRREARGRREGARWRREGGEREVREARGR
jgi:hypothetical protein